MEAWHPSERSVYFWLRALKRKEPQRVTAILALWRRPYDGVAD